MAPLAESQPRGPAVTRGFVVAGGRSSRMGRDKARLPFRGSTLIEHAIANARQAAPDIHILCGPSRRYEEFGVPVIEDPVCGTGPVGGLYAALLSASQDGREQIFWLAVDLPLVSPKFLSSLVAELAGADVAMARTMRGVEPLCAAFRTEPTLAWVRQSLLEGRLKLTSALEGLTLRLIDGEAADFANLNSPSDFERLL
ncbi:MAG: molybdenum cofactor guanylyltransferase [Vicinamibacteria bacterium]|nr:molybdenum cofactor guanylyltransferase [Vicinamibacteria bacterium]